LVQADSNPKADDTQSRNRNRKSAPKSAYNPVPITVTVPKPIKLRAPLAWQLTR